MKDLVEIIKNNPGCTLWTDNDAWQLLKELPEDIHEWSEEEQDEWHETEGILASDEDDFISLEGRVYSYHEDIILALAKIARIKCESV